MPKPSVATGIVFGAIGGVTTMLANAGGPAWQIHLLPQKIEKLPYIGTVSILFAASNLVKIPGFATLGYLTRENMLVGLTLVPIAVAVELCRHLAGAARLDRDVLPHRLCADVRHRGRADPQLGRRFVVALRPGARMTRHAGNRVARRSRCLRSNSSRMTIITDPLFYLVAIPAVIFLGLSKGGFSGIGMVSTPLLALIMPPLEAAAMLLPIILVQDAFSVWVYRRVWDPWNLKVMMPGCVSASARPGCSRLMCPTGAIRLVVGLIALGFVAYALLRHCLPGEPPRPRASHGVFWGALSGFTTTLIQIGAPPYYAFVLPQRLPKMIYVGTTVMFFAAANMMKVVPYFALGQFSTAGLRPRSRCSRWRSPATILGIWLVRVTPEAMFYQITNVIVFAARAAS